MFNIVHYIKFIGQQLTHMRLNNYILWAISLVVQLWILFSAPITWISMLTFFGTLLGVTTVISINAGKSVNGWFGILSGICFIIIGFSAKNYLSIAEQVSYMITLDLPVLISASWNKDLASKMRKFSALDWVVAVAFTAMVAIVSGLLISHLTNDPRPVFDSIAFAISFTGGLVCFLRFNNQYFWWLASGLAQLLLWFITFKQGGATLGMAVNSCIYIANDILAFTVSPWYNKKSRAESIKQDKELDRKNVMASKN